MKTRTRQGVAFARLARGLALAALAVAVGLSAAAQGPEDGPGMGPHRPPMERAMGPRAEHGRWWNEQRAIDKFKLTETQRKAMDEIYQQHRMSLVDLHGTLEKAELAMEPLMQADQPDEGKILEQIDRVAQARAELEKANARMLLGLRKELTPEQWKQVQADRAARHDAPGAMGAGHPWRQGRPPAPGQGPAPEGPGGSGPGGPGEF